MMIFLIIALRWRLRTEAEGLVQMSIKVTHHCQVPSVTRLRIQNSCAASINTAFQRFSMKQITGAPTHKSAMRVLQVTFP